MVIIGTQSAFLHNCQTTAVTTKGTESSTTASADTTSAPAETTAAPTTIEDTTTTNSTTTEAPIEPKNDQCKWESRKCTKDVRLTKHF
jgi:hypothetical protein